MYILPILYGLLSGICFYAGTVRTVSASRFSSDNSWRLFAWFSFFSALFGITTAVISQIDSPYAFSQAVRWEISLIAIIIIIYGWFVLTITKIGSRKLIIASTILFTVLFFINLFSPYSYQFHTLPVLQSIELPWGEVIWQAKEDASIWFNIGAVVLYLTIIYSAYAFGRLYWQQRSSFALWMFLSVVFLFVFAAIGYFARLAMIDIPLPGSLPVVAMVAVMSLAISHEIRRQQEELERSLRENEIFQKAILDYAGYAIISGTPEGVITSFNPAAERMLGYSAAEMIGKQTPAVFHDPAEVAQRAKEFSSELDITIEPGFEVFVAKARRDLPNEHEWTYIHKDGSRFPVLLTVTSLHDSSGEIFGFLGLAVDITERKRMESSLLASELRLIKQQDALIELAYHSVIATEEIKQVIEATTEIVARTLEVDRTGVWQLHDNNKYLVCSDLFESQYCRHSNGTQLNTASLPIYLSTLRKNNAIATNDTSSAPSIRELDNTPLKLADVGAALEVPLQRAGTTIGVLRCETINDTREWTTDEQNFASAVAYFLSLCIELRQHQNTTEELIKHRNHLEELVAARTSELEAANRELEAFSYSVSHDLRSPLRAINGFATILSEEYTHTLDETANDYLHRIQSSIQKIDVLVDSILQLSKISRAELIPVKVDLSGMADEILSDLQSNSPQRQVETHIAPGLETFGDDDLLHIALTNLLNNAWKYTSETEHTRIEFDQRILDDEKVFYIRDNGAGFKMEYADKLFTPFRRLHGPEFPGTGIGLATVARVIDRHGGRVWAEAEENKGAIFYFTINEVMSNDSDNSNIANKMELGNNIS